MTDCEYCSESFADEESYLAHLESEHEGELSAIDQRRVEDVSTDETSGSIGMVVIAVVMLGSFAVVGYVAFFSGGGSGQDGPHGSAHEHGTIAIEVDGERLNLLKPTLSNQNNQHFHSHGGEDRIEPGLFLWHKHSQGVSLKFALGTYGIDVSDDGSEITIGNETYDDSDPNTEVDILVNGESVEPGSYDISGVEVSGARAGDGDDIRVEIQTE